MCRQLILLLGETFFDFWGRGLMLVRVVQVHNTYIGRICLTFLRFQMEHFPYVAQSDCEGWLGAGAGDVRVGCVGEPLLEVGRGRL